MRRKVFDEDKAMIVAALTAGSLSIRSPRSVERWLDNTVRPALRERTYDQYQYIVHRYLIPRLGGMIITQVMPAHTHDMLAALEKDGVSPRVRQLIYVVLHRALGQALRWETVVRNACDALVRPRHVECLWP